MPDRRERPTDADLEEQHRAIDELERVEAGLARAPRWSAEAGRLDEQRARILSRLAAWDERFRVSEPEAPRPAAARRRRPDAVR
jgi:hypothetical protein